MTDDTFTAGDDIEAGAYNATLTEIIRKTSKKDGNEFRIWRFHTPEGVELSGSSSIASGPMSKTARWAKAILGRAPTPGDPIGVLYGKRCTVAVETSEEGFARVVEVHPAAPAKAARSQPIPTSVVTSVPATNGGPENVPWDAEAVTEDAIPF